MSFAMPANDSQPSRWSPPAPGDAPEGKQDAPGFASLVLRLRLCLRRDPDPRKRELVEHILTAAAESEQQLAELAERVAELEALSTTDDLTGLPNRRGFEQYMRAELARSQRDGRGGSLAFLDLDCFKAINDRYGHAAGDSVLCQVAQRLRPAARAADFIARLHGDEFVLALSGASPEKATPRMTELINRIERQPLRFGDQLIPLALSYGLTSYDGTSTLDNLIRASDRAMYANKQARRPASQGGKPEI
ncbi:MAG TPA: GGDEF domain-containing protein [Ferrovibrio sp.]|jgi:diguanylate cyclase (GGDEF)-like protein|uniref:GGDEF domain-containing protein n=1 Tax=Ferrovibrio sp. TaxID=1917215 RepID=UPI002ED1F40E